MVARAGDPGSGETCPSVLCNTVPRWRRATLTPTSVMYIRRAATCFVHYRPQAERGSSLYRRRGPPRLRTFTAIAFVQT